MFRKYKICVVCEKRYLVEKIRQRYCSLCRTIKKEESYWKFRNSERGRELYKRSGLKYIKTEKGKENRKRYVEKHRQSINEQNYGYLIRFKKAVYEKLGNKCVRCGFSDWRALQIDHVYGGGRKDRLGLSSRSFYKKILADDSDKYQILCANCNQIKRIENNE